MKGAFIGFLVMLALGAGGSTAARMTVLREAASPNDTPAVSAPAGPQSSGASAQPSLTDAIAHPDIQP